VRRNKRCAINEPHEGMEKQYDHLPNFLACRRRTLLQPKLRRRRGDVRERETVQSLTLAALRALGVADARARGLVVQTTLPAYGDAAEQSS